MMSDPQFYGYMISGILIAGGGMSLCALIFTIVLTSTKQPRLYQLLRFGMTTAGFSLGTFLMACWVFICIFFEGSLNAAQVRELWIGLACYSIPLIMGMAAAIGPRYQQALWLGRIILYVATPLAGAALTTTISIAPNDTDDAIFFFLLYFSVTTLWWEGLIHWDKKLQKKRQALMDEA